MLIGADEMEGLADMLRSVTQYLPDVEISTIKDGRMLPLYDNSTAVDTLGDPPIIHAESVDADELSMLLDGSDLGTEE